MALWRIDDLWWRELGDVVRWQAGWRCRLMVHLPQPGPYVFLDKMRSFKCLSSLILVGVPCSRRFCQQTPISALCLEFARSGDIRS
jgi:hypothetical protein